MIHSVAFCDVPIRFGVQLESATLSDDVSKLRLGYRLVNALVTKEQAGGKWLTMLLGYRQGDVKPPFIRHGGISRCRRCCCCRRRRRYPVVMMLGGKTEMVSDRAKHEEVSPSVGVRSEKWLSSCHRDVVRKSGYAER